MLLHKYKPEKIEDMVNKEAAREIKTLIFEKKKFIITGPIGSGKSLSLEIIAKEMKFELINVTDEIFDSKEITKQRSIFYKGKIFVVDLDSIRSLEKLEEFIKECSFSMVMAADDIYQKRYYDIRKKFSLVKFRKISDIYLMNIIKRICLKENIEYSEIALGKLISMYSGDIRAVLITLECIKSEGVTQDSIKSIEECKSLNVFDVLTEVFNGDFKKSTRLLSNMDQDILPWIEENVVDGKSLEAQELVARADLFKSRVIRTNNWSLNKYYFDFLGGISTLKTGRRMFNPPYSKMKVRATKSKSLKKVVKKSKK
ncbi:MAG: hypothetical protein HY831_04140 [Candidatus Aenigmarchaeota archaeon]|nr:hypothetical protein [Candidatus Aenigmarchaeota archaeon]